MVVLMVVDPRVFHDGVLDVVELLAGGADTVMEGVVVLNHGRQRGRLRVDPRVGAPLPPPPHAPQQHGGDRQHPDNYHCGNQQRHEVVGVGVVALSFLDSNLGDGADDGAVGAPLADQVHDSVRDFLDEGQTFPRVVCRDGDVDLITGAERRLAGYRDGGVGGQILDDVETPEHTTNLLHRHTLCHDILVEGEGDVGAAALQVTPGCGRGPVGGPPALPLAEAGLDEAALVPDGDAGLPGWTLGAASLTVQAARFRSTPKLCADDSPVVTAALVAVFVPRASVQSHQPSDHTGPPRRFLAAGPGPSWWTDAAVTVDFIHTGGAEGAGRRLTLIDVDPAVWAGEPRSTFTSVPVVSIDTGPTVITGMRTAVVGIVAAGGALPALLTDAAEGVSVHHAGSSVLAGTRQTAAVLRDVTGGPLPACSAHTLEGVDFIIAGSPVVTGRLVTLTLSRVTGLSLPAVVTLAVEVVDQIPTDAAVLTGSRAAVIDVVLAGRSVPAFSTDALILTDFIDTGCSIQTGGALTVVYILVAVRAGESLLTLAAELSASVTATPPVGAAHVGRNQTHPARCAIGRHSHCAAVNHFAGRGAAVVLQARAVLALVVFGTFTDVVGHQVETLAAVLTRTVEAVVDIQLTATSRETRRTQAVEAVDLVVAAAAIEAWPAGALVHVFLTVVAAETGSAHTLITIHQVLARCSVLTLASTVVDIGVTVLAHPTRETLAEVSSNQVSAGVAIDAGVVVTLVGVDKAGLSGPLRRTGTLETINQVLTGSSITAGVLQTLVHIDGAGGSGPSRGTAALKTQTGFSTASSVQTGVGQAGMVGSLTADPREAIRTGAVVFVRPRVAAGSSIQTRLQRRTSVQIFVTQLSTKVGVTETLPGLHTAAVNTAGMRDALITVLPLPAIQTLALSGNFTGSVFCTTALSADRSVAVRTGPALQARLVAVVVALVVAEEVVSRAAELVAAEAVVVLVAAEADLKVELSHGAVVLQALPLPAGVDHPRVHGFLNHRPTDAARGRVVVEVQGFHDQRVRPRPREAERQHDPGFVALGTVHRKGIPAKHRRGGGAEAAGPGRGYLQLVLLQAHPEVGVAFIRGAAPIRGVPGSVTAGASMKLPVNVLHRQNLKLKVSRS